MQLGAVAPRVSLLALAVVAAGCARGIDVPIDLTGSSTGGAGSMNAGSGGAPLADGAGSGDAGSAGAAGAGDASSGGAGAGGTNVEAGLDDRNPVNDAIANAPSDARDARSDATDARPDVARTPDAQADARVDARADAVGDSGCSDPTQCAALRAALVHRYSFNGADTVVTDSIGTANGTVVNGVLAGNGTLVVPPGVDEYVDLPNGIISQLTNATLELWITWNGNTVWQRIFDFGSSAGGENVRDMALTTFYLTPQGGAPVFFFTGFKNINQISTAETRAVSAVSLPIGVMVHVAVVVDDANNVLSLYRNGLLDAVVALPDSLSAINDFNNWLGRSQYPTDQNFVGTFHEFRIYGVALSAAAIGVSFAGGPDPAFLN